MSLQFHTHPGFPALRTIGQGRGGDPSMQPPEGQDGGLEGCWTPSSRSPAETQDNTFSRGQASSSFPDDLWVCNMCICCVLVLEMDGPEIWGEPAWHGASDAGACNTAPPHPQSLGHLVPRGFASPQDFRVWILRSKDAKRVKGSLAQVTVSLPRLRFWQKTRNKRPWELGRLQCVISMVFRAGFVLSSVRGRKTNVQDTSHSLRPTLLSGCTFLIPMPGLLCLGSRVWTPPAPACLPLPLRLLSAPHRILQDPWIPRPFILGLWANTFPLEVHFSAGQRHPWPRVPGLPILLLTCLVTSIPTHARFLTSLDPWEPVSTWGGGQGLRVQPLPAPVHPVKPLTPWQHRNLP